AGGAFFSRAVRQLRRQQLRSPLSKGWPQAPRPEAPVRARLVHGDGVIPAHDGVVEQVQPEAGAVAAQRVSLSRDIVVRGPGEIERLVLGPCRTDVVEEEPV